MYQHGHIVMYAQLSVFTPTRTDNWFKARPRERSPDLILYQISIITAGCKGSELSRRDITCGETAGQHVQSSIIVLCSK